MPSEVRVTPAPPLDLTVEEIEEINAGEQEQEPSGSAAQTETRSYVASAHRYVAISRR